MAAPNIKDWMKKNFTGVGGAANIGFSALGIAGAENKFKGLLVALKDLVIWPAIISAAFSKMFGGMMSGLKSLVHSTGSLEAALAKLAKIQGLQKVFSSMAGGAEAAKRKVAELVTLAANKNLSLDEVAEGARNLQILTKGAYSGAAALNEVADAAHGTGAGFEALANAVGQFSETLSEGGSIKQNADELFKMGAITDSVRNQLVRLQQDGASSGEVFDTMREALKRFKGSADESKDSLQGVTAAHEKAAKALKEEFGKPFTDKEIENTKNWTEVMIALKPVVASVASVVSTLTGSTASVTSSIAKWATAMPLLGSALSYAFNAVVALVGVLSVLGTIKFAQWALSSTGYIMSMTASLGKLTLAARVAGFAVVGLMTATMVIGAAIAIFAAIAGAINHYTEAQNAAKKAVEDFKKETDDLVSSLKKQADAMQTLEDRATAYAASLEEITKAKVALEQAEAEYASSGSKEQSFSVNGMPITKAGTAGDPAKKAIVDAAKARLDALTKSANGTRNTSDSLLELPASVRQKMLDDARKARDEEESEFQRRLAAAPIGDQAGMLRSRAAALAARGTAGQVSVDANAALEGARSKAQESVMEKQAALNEANRLRGLGGAYSGQAGKDKVSAAEAELNKAKEDRRNIDSLAPAGSVPRLAWEVREMREGRMDKEKLHTTMAALGIAQVDMQAATGGGDAARARALGSQGTAQQKEMGLAAHGRELELRTQRAMLGGNAQELIAIENQKMFEEAYERGRTQGLNPGKATSFATDFTRNSIDLRARQSGFAADKEAAVSSLARSGGGGGVENVQNTMLDLTRSMERVARDSAETLKRIENKFDTNAQALPP